MIASRAAKPLPPKIRSSSQGSYILVLAARDAELISDMALATISSLSSEAQMAQYGMLAGYNPPRALP